MAASQSTMNPSSIVINSTSTEPKAVHSSSVHPQNIIATLASRSRYLAMAALAAAFLGLAAPAQAANNYYAAVLKNNTNIAVSFYISVNNGPVKLYTLRPGQSLPCSFYKPTGHINVVVYHDSRLSDGRLTWTSRRLNMWGCSAPAHGWQQAFIRVNDGNDLVISG
jgi:hypothetical protein